MVVQRLFRDTEGEKTDEGAMKTSALHHSQRVRLRLIFRSECTYKKES